MPAIQIFQTLRDKVAKTGTRIPEERRAMFWFTEYAAALTSWQSTNVRMSFNTLKTREFTKQLVGANAALPGFFYFFMYQAKLAQTLPYWDAFPFVLVLNRYDDGFLGLNFHYLDYQDRARLFDAMYPLREGRPARPDTRDIRMRLRLTYAILKMANTTKYRHWKACIKRYLTPHVRTPLMKVGAKEWDLALMLPVHQFQKKSVTVVWRDSKRK
jgi:hypothetical protein